MRIKLLAFLSLLPIFAIFIAFLILPLGWILINAFYVEELEAYSLENFTRIFSSQFYTQSIWQSLSVSFYSSVIGLIIATMTSYSIYVLKPSKLSSFLLSLNTMLSNFAGIPLAFACIIIFGNNGVINVLLKNMGIEPFFSIYSNIGINLVYIYFQIPLGVLLLFPAFKALEESHKNASKMLGASNIIYWIKIACPLLAPALLGVFVILFANALGAYASIYALNSNFNILPIRITSLVAGDISLDPYLASALSLVLMLIMLGITLIANFINKKYNFKAL